MMGEPKIIPQPDGYYTYRDYRTWKDRHHWELVEGVPHGVSMSSRLHQEVVGGICRQLVNGLHGRSGKVLVAPFTVRLNPDTEDDTVCQPDILVVCDESKLDKVCCNGAPDLVVEILSPTTAKIDTVDKLELYKRSGVREYWMVYPEKRFVQVCVLLDGMYIIDAYGDTDKVSVKILGGCNIDLQLVFHSCNYDHSCI